MEICENKVNFGKRKYTHSNEIQSRQSNETHTDTRMHTRTVGK